MLAGGELNVQIRALVVLFSIGLTIWLVFAWIGYGQRYAQATEGWHRGGTHLVELTLIREDVQNLACASDVVLGGLRCAYRADQREHEPRLDDRQWLRPYSTVKGDLLLGSGLWSAASLPTDLPAQRFTVACNFHVVGVMKSVAFRWSQQGSFDPARQSIAAGTLSDCVIPP